MSSSSRTNNTRALQETVSENDVLLLLSLKYKTNIIIICSTEDGQNRRTERVLTMISNYKVKTQVIVVVIRVEVYHNNNIITI